MYFNYPYFVLGIVTTKVNEIFSRRSLSSWRRVIKTDIIRGVRTTMETVVCHKSPQCLPWECEERTLGLGLWVVLGFEGQS